MTSRVTHARVALPGFVSTIHSQGLPSGRVRVSHRVTDELGDTERVLTGCYAQRFELISNLKRDHFNAIRLWRSLYLTHTHNVYAAARQFHGNQRR